VRKRGDSNLYTALYSIVGALDFCRDISAHMDEMLSEGRRKNAEARDAIEKIAAEVVAAHRRAA